MAGPTTTTTNASNQQQQQQQDHEKGVVKNNEETTSSSMSTTAAPTTTGRRKRRWGTAADAANSSSSSTGTTTTGGIATPAASSTTPTTMATTALTGKAKLLAMQESIKARLAAAKAKQQQQQQQPAAGATTTTASASSNRPQKRSRWQPASTTASASDAGTSGPTAKRAKHFDVDLSVTTTTATNSTTSSIGTSLKSSSKKRQLAAVTRQDDDAAADDEEKGPPVPTNPYLAHMAEVEVSDKKQAKKKKHKRGKKETVSKEKIELKHQQEQDEQDGILDARLQRAGKNRQRHKALQFNEPGHWQRVAETVRQRAANAAAAGFLSGRKVGNRILAASLVTDDNNDNEDETGLDAYTAAGRECTAEELADRVARMAAQHPRADAVPGAMPLCMEWWDMELLPTKLKKQVATAEARALKSQTAASHNTLQPTTTTRTTAGAAAATTDTDTTTTDNQEEPSAENTTANPTTTTEEEKREKEQKHMEQLRQSCWNHAALSYSKTAALVQHIVPIQSPHARTGPEPQPVLHLTKKELKRQRKLRRQAKQQELQDLQAAGLIEAPQPKLTLQNFIQVMGDAAFIDPSLIERKVQEQVQARKRAHEERNQARKLTPAERTAKRARKLVTDTENATTHGSLAVALFYVKDVSHPYHRAKMDLNAQQMKITGVVLECQAPAMACVLCEGGPKALQKYIRLMTVRISWQGLEDEYDDDDDVKTEPVKSKASGDAAAVGGEDDAAAAPSAKQPFNPNNRCDLIWQGMTTQRLFPNFSFQLCETASQAKQVLQSKHVGQYWDQVFQHHLALPQQGGAGGGAMSRLRLKMAPPPTTTTTTTQENVRHEIDKNDDAMDVDHSEEDKEQQHNSSKDMT